MITIAVRDCQLVNCREEREKEMEAWVSERTHRNVYDSSFTVRANCTTATIQSFIFRAVFRRTFRNLGFCMAM
jgi:hypothetical protein